MRKRVYKFLSTSIITKNLLKQPNKHKNYFHERVSRSELKVMKESTLLDVNDVSTKDGATINFKVDRGFKCKFYIEGITLCFKFALLTSTDM